MSLAEDATEAGTPGSAGGVGDTAAESGGAEPGQPPESAPEELERTRASTEEEPETEPEHEEGGENEGESETTDEDDRTEHEEEEEPPRRNRERGKDRQARQRERAQAGGNEDAPAAELGDDEGLHEGPQAGDPKVPLDEALGNAGMKMEEREREQFGQWVKDRHAEGGQHNHYGMSRDEAQRLQRDVKAFRSEFRPRRGR
jgi:hypothetical protein